MQKRITNLYFQTNNVPIFSYKNDFSRKRIRKFLSNPR
jgi:hypothetical protein